MKKFITHRKNGRGMLCLLLPVLGLFLQQCFFPSSQYQGLRVESDEVKGITRLTTDFWYGQALERLSPLHSVRQTVLKEVNASGNASYTFYETIQLSSSAHNLENKIYWLIEAEIIPININPQIELLTEIDKQTDDILTADSTKVEVVTGYSTYQVRQFKINYTLSPQDMERILSVEELRLRYYSGPSMITTRLHGRDLARLKELISKRG